MASSYVKKVLQIFLNQRQITLKSVALLPRLIIGSSLFCSLLQTTGLYGLDVVQNPEHRLRVLYGKILRTLQKTPPQAAYRKYTEETVKSRLQVVADVRS